MATESLQSLLDKAILDGVAPGLSAVAFTRSSLIAEAASGVSDVSTNSPLQLDTTISFASASKSIVSLLVLILAEKIKIDFDSHEELVKIVPELGKDWDGTKLWTLFDGKDENGEYKFKEATVGITLRHLLDHTAGNPIFFVREEAAWLRNNRTAPPDAFEAFNNPRVHEAGSAWVYGESVEYLNFFITRVSGVSFRRAVQDLVFTPLNIPIDTLDVFRTPVMDQRKGGLALKVTKQDGAGETFIPLPFPFDTPQYEDVPPKGYQVLASAPVWGSIQSFALVIQSFLNPQGPVDHRTGAPLLSETAWKEATADSLAESGISIKQPGFNKATDPLAEDVDWWIKPADCNGETSLGWTMLQTTKLKAESATGLKKGTIGWSGLANSYYFLDLESGIGGVISSQFFPWAAPRMLELRDVFERWVVEQTRAGGQ